MSGKQQDQDGETVDGGTQADRQAKPAEPGKAKEIGGRKGPDPTRYGDWEKNGRCVDF